MIETLKKYFPDLSSCQSEQLTLLGPLYTEWNDRINVISRKDIEQLYTRHVLHSLAIAKVCSFAPGARILDVGTGGGFPGIPLAILFPEAKFTLIDSIGKKIRVVNEVATGLNLSNVRAIQTRAEAIPEKFDFVVSRAVIEMKTFVGWVWNKMDSGVSAGTLPNGIFYLKGGDLDTELDIVKKTYAVYPISDFFDDPFFTTKQVVYFRR